MLLDERVRSELAGSTRFDDIRLLEVTDSTNRVAAELAASGAPEGLVVSADLQTAGRGRLDRSWQAEPGSSLLASVLLRPAGLAPDRLHLATAAAGLAAREACEGTAGYLPDLKWPNDLLAGDRKLAGILAETTSGALIVGMGLNVHSGPPGSASLDELSGRRVDRAELLAAWLRALDRLLGAWDVVSSRYRLECSTVGRRVRVEQSGGDFSGVAERIDEDGRLVVRPDGPGSAPVAVSAGDVVHLRPDGGAW